MLTITGIHPDYGMYEGRIPLIIGKTFKRNAHPDNRYWGLGAYAGGSSVFFDGPAYRELTVLGCDQTFPVCGVHLGRL